MAKLKSIRPESDRILHQIMNKKPLISAVINVRNEAEALNKCLRSIKNMVDEIIIVDMNSTDGSQEIAK
ncbi:MAG: glycosyltransferase, partial [Candidatus Shapirobacteria bacterium]|nr:glycosyltransferase [Candidatus Shapirobacteria bacterium]